MSLRLFALPCGSLDSDLGLFLEGERGAIRIPVPAWLILHPRGSVVFDSGLHVDTQRDPDARLGALATIFRVSFAPGEELASQLAALEVDAARVACPISSHLHFDPVGGNAQLPNARWVQQRREWEAAQAAELRAGNHSNPRDFGRGHDRLLALEAAGARLSLGHDPAPFANAPNAPFELV